MLDDVAWQVRWEGRRAGLALPVSSPVGAGACAAVLAPLSPSRSSSASSSCAIAVSSFSDERPNCSRRSLASWARSSAIRACCPSSSTCWRAIVAACAAISARTSSGIMERSIDTSRS